MLNVYRKKTIWFRCSTLEELKEKEMGGGEKKKAELNSFEDLHSSN